MAMASSGKEARQTAATEKQQEELLLHLLSVPYNGRFELPSWMPHLRLSQANQNLAKELSWINALVKKE